MAHPNAGTTEFLALRGREVHTVSQPGPALQPTQLLDEFQRPAAVCRFAVLVLVDGFGEVGVKAAIEAFGQIRARTHERRRD